jgi:hypothetical protein
MRPPGRATGGGRKRDEAIERTSVSLPTPRPTPQPWCTQATGCRFAFCAADSGGPTCGFRGILIRNVERVSCVLSSLQTGRVRRNCVVRQPAYCIGVRTASEPYTAQMPAPGPRGADWARSCAPYSVALQRLPQVADRGEKFVAEAWIEFGLDVFECAHGGAELLHPRWGLTQRCANSS